MKILHLYYDIMNLYGDYGNVSVLERVLTQSGADCEVVKKSLGDSVDFAEYDFVFIGSGTERNQKLVLDDFKKHKEAFKNYIESGKPALFTGNSFEMLGKSITDCEGKAYDGTGLFGFFRVTGNQYFFIAENPVLRKNVTQKRFRKIHITYKSDMLT